MIVIHQDIRSVARLNLVGRDHDLHQATRPHIAALAPASLATEIEPMVTSNEYRWMHHTLVNTGRDIMVSAPALNQGEDLYELPEAGSADQPGRVKSTFRLITVLAPTTDRREDLRETPEACTAGPCRRAESSATTIRQSGQECLGRYPRGYSEVDEVREDRTMERETMTIVTGID